MFDIHDRSTGLKDAHRGTVPLNGATVRWPGGETVSLSGASGQSDHHRLAPRVNRVLGCVGCWQLLLCVLCMMPQGVGACLSVRVCTPGETRDSLSGCRCFLLALLHGIPGPNGCSGWLSMMLTHAPDALYHIFPCNSSQSIVGHYSQRLTQRMASCSVSEPRTTESHPGWPSLAVIFKTSVRGCPCLSVDDHNPS